VLNRRDRNTGDLFDPWAHLGPKRRRILDDAWSGTFRKHVLPALDLSALNGSFAAVMGRPGKVPQVVVGLLVLQQMHDTTDADTLAMLAFNEQWHYALNVRQEDEMYVCDKTLRNWRNRLIAVGLDKELFAKVTDVLAKHHKVDPTRQRIDSTRITSNMAKLSRLGIMVRTIEMFLARVKKQHPDLWPAVEPGIIERHLGKDGFKGTFSSVRPTETQRRLPEAAEDLLTLVRQFKETPAEKLKEYRLLERVLKEQCQVIPGDDADGRGPAVQARESALVGGGSLQNPSDPDVTYNAHKGQGYRVQIMETHQAQADDGVEPAGPNLITHVSVGAMNEHDAAALMPAIQDVSDRGLAPKEISGDTHYGTQDNCEQTAAMGVELLSPAQAPKGTEKGKLFLEDFVLDEKNRVLSCPAGHVPLSVIVSEKRGQASFDAATCQGCPLRDRCPVQKPESAGAKTVRVQYDQPRLEMRERRLKEKEPSFLERYRMRAGIEGTMSRLKHVLGMARLRVRTLAKVTYVVCLKALGMNILRCAAVKA
jgi:Transposase DDE domain/Transposase domain (DUF772)